MSPKNTLSYKDIKEWIIQSIIYSILIPWAVIFLTAFQSNGFDPKAAWGVSSYALIAAAINLLNKFRSGQQQFG